MFSKFYVGKFFFFFLLRDFEIMEMECLNAVLLLPPELSDSDTIVSSPDNEQDEHSDSDSDTLQPPLSRSHSSSTLTSYHSLASHVSRATTRSVRSHHSWQSDDVSHNAADVSNASFRSAAGCKQHHR